MKTKNYCLLAFIFISQLLKAQYNPSFYYTFETSTQNGLVYNPYFNGASGDLSSQCQTCAIALNGGTNTAAIPTLHSSPWPTTDHFLKSTIATKPTRSQTNSVSSPTGDFVIEFIARFAPAYNQVSEELFRIHPSSAESTQGASVVFNFTTANGDPPNITFTTNLSGTSGNINDNFVIVLDGIGRKSQSYYFTPVNTWHHFVFIYSHTTGKKTVWVDGESPAEFSKTLTTATNGQLQGPHRLMIHPQVTAYKQHIGDIDEVAFFDGIIPDEQIYQNYLDVFDLQTSNPNPNRHYRLLLAPSIPNPQVVTSYVLDPFEFAAGHDNINFPGKSNELHSEGTVDSSIIQLRKYQLPRFLNGHTLNRNMNILTTKYLSNNYRFQNASAVEHSAQIQHELARNWNYYYNVTENASSDYNDYSNPNEFAGKWISKANSAIPPYKLAAVILRRQLNPNAVLHVNNGPVYTQDAYVVRQDWQNPLNHYVNNGAAYLNRAGNITTGTRFISPARIISGWTTPNVQDGVDSDGVVMSLIFDKLDIYLNQTIDFISENNEITNRFTNPVTCPSISATIAKAFCNDPYIKNDYANELSLGNVANWEEYDAMKKRDLDNDYRDKLLANPVCSTAWFSNYAVDGFENYRYKYKFLRKTQPLITTSLTPLKTQRYPTPDFYPGSPKNWDIEAAGGLIHGWRWVANGRFTELDPAYNDNRFAPFVAAGWARNENNNIRPGQWLGMLKCLNLLGVDFYQPGFFNVDGPYGPNNLPANPGAYIWQGVTPVYAQAIASRYEDFLKNGVVLEGNVPEDPSNTSSRNMYQFGSTNPDHLVAVRANTSIAPNKFVIAGSIQTSFSIPGNSPLNDIATISLDGEILQFPIRRQGSTYIYDKSVTPYLFYQLDEWHEYKHPEWWSKDFKFDAEVYDNSVSTSVIGTEDLSGGSISSGNYSNFISYVSGTANTFIYHFTPRIATAYTLYIKARNQGSGTIPSSINIQISGNGTPVNKVLGCIEDQDWKWYAAEVSGAAITYAGAAGIEQAISLNPQSNDLYIDKIVLSATTQLNEAGIIISSAGCTGNNVRFTASVNNASCHGLSNGSIALTGLGGTPGYTYSINGGAFQSNNVFGGLATGTYKFRVRDINLAVSSEQLVFVDEPKLLTATAFPKNVTCYGLTDGIISISTLGGTSPYTYNWSNSLPSLPVVNNLSAGAYTVSVVDANGCTVASITESINAPTAPPTATVTLELPTTLTQKCELRNIKFQINTPGQPYYDYSINGGNSYQRGNVGMPTAAFLFENQQPGTYNLVMQDSKGCTVSLNNSSLSIIAMNNNNLNISSTPPTCAGNDGSITATEIGGTGPYNYQWNNGATCNAATSCQISNLGPNTYTVTVTDQNNCPASKSILLSSGSGITYSITITDALCVGSPGSIAFHTIGGGVAPYSFSVDGGITYSSPPNNTFNMQPGNYWISVKDANGCLSNDQNVTVSLNSTDCCTGNTALLQFDFDNSSLASPITGLHDLNMPITISNGTAYLNACTLKIAENVSITVNAGATLIIQNQSILSSCGNMWPGIINLGGTVIIENSSIEDAIDALRSVTNGSTFQVSNSYFARNYKSVTLIDGDYSSSYFYNNEFEGAQTLKNSFGITLNETHSHFFIANSQAIIGQAAMGINIFRNGTYGIYLSASTLDIDNCLFDQPGVVNNSASEKAGISCINQNILNCGLNQMVTFQNGTCGIYQRANTDVINVRNSTFTSLGEGINCYHSWITNLITNDNVFEDCYYGMILNLVNQSESIEILDNTFNGASDVNHYPENENAISLYFPYGNHSSIQISRNTISDYPIGIYAVNLSAKINDQSISENLIYYSEFLNVGAYPHGMRGIQLQNCYRTFVTDNTVAWDIDVLDPNSSYDIRGIYFDNSQMCLIKDNHIVKMGMGIFGSNHCEETALRCNTVVDCYPFGMNFENIFLPDQGDYYHPTFNNWFGAYDQSITGVNKIDGSGNLINWYYDGATAFSNPMYPRPSPSFLINDVYAGGYDLNDYPCSINNEERYNGDPDARSSNIDLIVHDAKTYTDNIEENKYYDMDYAYKMMKIDSTLITDELHEDFMQFHAEDPIGLLSEVQDLTVANNIAAAAQINDVVYDQNLIEENKKIVNEIFLASNNLDSLFESDSTVIPILQSIAYQSVVTGGEGVYWARGLLKLRIEDTYTSSSRFSSNQKAANSSNDVKLYPNPTNNYVFVEALKGGLIRKIEVFNSQSSLIRHNIEKSNKINVSTTNLMDGFYTLVVQLLDNSLHYLKLSIIH